MCDRTLKIKMMTTFEKWLKETYNIDITTLSWNDYVKYTKEFENKQSGVQNA